MMKEDKDLGWGKSLPVPSVQEMVKNASNTAPHRYIREDEERPVIEGPLPTTSEIPVIDFSLLAIRDADEQKKMDFACKEWGFFQLVNHGVVEELVQKMKKAEAPFFELSLEEKKKYAMAENDVQGYGQAFVVSEEQKLDWCDMSFLVTFPPEQRNLKYWPLTVTGFKETVEEYTGEICKVSEELLANLSVLMSLKEDSLKELHKVMKIGMRMNYYPPCPKPELVLGISPHSDGATITFLLQDDDLTALQIRHKGQWIPIKPIPGAFVVNIGDTIEAWSNGMYKSIEHRAITNSKKARISLAMFVMPDNEAEIAPVEPMLQDRPAAYTKIKYIDFMRRYVDRKLGGKATDIIVSNGK